MLSNIPPHRLLRDLDPQPLSAAAASELQRARVFLYGAARTGREVQLLMRGYTETIHQTGVYLMKHLAGEGTFEEWRCWRSLRPPRDPDLPALVDEVTAFADRWIARARVAIARLADPDDREELLGFIEDDTVFPSRTWRAKALVARIAHFKKVPTTFHREVADALAAEGFEEEHRAFCETLKTLQAWIASAALDEREREEIHAAREANAESLRTWLAERRAELADLGASELAVLGLGDVEPPGGFEPPAHLLMMSRPAAKA